MHLTYQEYPCENQNPKHLVMLLHGYGSNARDLLSITPELKIYLPHTHFISPNAPFNYEGGGEDAYQWFSLERRDEEFLIEGAKIARKILDNFIDSQLDRFSLKSDKLSIVGFSQGTMIGLYTALRRQEKIGSVLGYSGMLLGYEELSKEITAKPPVMLIHGSEDQVLPSYLMNKAEKTLTLAGVDCKTMLTPKLGHGIDNSGIKQGINFLKMTLIEKNVVK